MGGIRLLGLGGGEAQAWVTLIVGGLAAIGVIVTWQQKNKADRRSEWWRRTTWALERTFTPDDIQAEVGWSALTSSGLAARSRGNVGDLAHSRCSPSM